MKASVEVLKSDDVEKFTELILVFKEVFEMEDFVMPVSQHQEKLLKQDRFRVVIATVENRIIGGLTMYVLDQYYSEKPLAYLYDLAVLTEFQRMGIGKQLMHFANNYCCELGFEELFVHAESIDVHALDFYRTTHPDGEMQVVQFYYKTRNNKI